MADAHATKQQWGWRKWLGWLLCAHEPMRRFATIQAAVLLVACAHLHPSIRVARASPAPGNSGQTAPETPERPPKPPKQGYTSRGVMSRFGFGVGLYLGISSLRSGNPMVGGLSAHFRMSGIAGISLEIDFNQISPSQAPDDLSIKGLHFVPNLRVAAVIYLYRWRMLAPYIFGGAGIDTRAKNDRTNLQVGGGLEITFWHHRFAALVEFRGFLPRPADAQKLKERIQITGTHAKVTTGDIYKVINTLVTISVRFYY